MWVVYKFQFFAQRYKKNATPKVFCIKKVQQRREKTVFFPFFGVKDVNLHYPFRGFNLMSLSTKLNAQ